MNANSRLIYLFSILFFLVLTVSVQAQPDDVIFHDNPDLYSTSIKLSWDESQEDGFSEYRLYRSSSSSVDTSGLLVFTGLVKNQTVFTDTSLHVATTYYYKLFVFARDTLSAGSNVVSAVTKPNGYPFFDDMEGNSAILWSPGAPWGLSETSPFGGSKSWADSPDGNYDNSIAKSLHLRIDLSTAQMPLLSFMTRYSTQANYDFCRVEISDNGSSWTVAGYWSGSQSTWKEKRIDLSPWQGIADVRIRFRLTTNGSSVSDGWYIDNVKIDETETPALPYPFQDSFDDNASEGKWHLSQWTIDAGGRKQSNLIHDSPEGNYLASGGSGSSDNPNSFSGFITSGVLDLSGAIDPVLVFHQKYDLWSSTSGDRPEHDKGRVYISKSFGQPGTWVQLYEIKGTSTSDWSRVEIDLSNYTIPNVRFKFIVDDQRDQNPGWNGDQSVTRNGWWLDDIRIEDRPKLVSTLSAGNVSMHGASLSWDMNTDNDFARYQIRRSTSENVNSGSELIKVIDDQAVTSYRDNYQILRPQTYYYRIYVIDTLETMSKGGNVVQAVYSVPTVNFPFADSVETAADTSNWAWGYPWGRTSKKSHSGDFCWTDSPDASYSPNANTALSTTVNLSGSSTPALTFWHQYNFETNVDFGRVQISQDGGATWKNLLKVTGVDDTWSKQRIDLTPYSGNTIGLRFLVVSDGETHSDGWYIDDITIEDGKRIADYPFAEDFENGFDRWFISNPWGLTTDSPFEGSYCFTDSPSGTYADNTSSSLLLHINLSNAQMPHLSFYSRFSTQANYDFLRVEISIDGSSWVVIGYWTGSQSEWKNHTIDLTPWQGSSDVRLRWRITTNSSSVSDGWYLDKIEIKETPVAELSYPFLEYFDDSSFYGKWHSTQWDITTDGKTVPGRVHDSPAGNYLPSGGSGSTDNPNSFTALTSVGVVDLSAAVDPVLTFYQKYDIWYSTGGDRPENDLGRVYVSADKGLPGTWKQIYTVKGTSVDNWGKVTLDLKEYEKSKIRLRFVLDDQRDQNPGWNGDQSVVKNGWWIDDIRIENRPAFVQLKPPTNVSIGGADISWSKNLDDDFDRYVIYRSSSENVSMSSTLIAEIYSQDQTSFRDDYQTLRPKKYYYRMYVYDTLNTPSQPSNIVAADYEIPVNAFPFTDTVSTASDTMWAKGYTWKRTTRTAHSGEFSWTDSPESSYPANANFSLTSNINLSGSSSPVLTFWHKYALEDAADYGFVEVSTDGGSSWIRVHKVTGVDTSWNNERVNLSSYIGSLIGLRFRIQTNGTNHLDGWYIDDIVIEDGTQIVGYPFMDDMESGISNWFAGSPWGLTDVNPKSGKYCWTDSPAGSYSNNTNSSLSLRIDLSTAKMPLLTFWTHFATEHNYSPRDVCRLEVSVDGSYWTVLAYWWGSQSTWKKVNVDLTNYQGNSDVRIRWRFNTNSGTTSDGWYIDDVSIQESDIAELPFPFFDDFNDSSTYSKWRYGSWGLESAGLDGTTRLHESPYGSYLPSGGTGSSDNPNSFAEIVTSGVLDLSKAIDPVLTFYHKHDLWYNTGGDRPERDYGRIYISTNFGLPGTWSQIYSVTNSSTSSWKKVSVNLSQYKLPNIRIKLIVDDQRDQNSGWNGDQSVVRNGWWIDNFAIYDNLSSSNIPDKVLIEHPAALATTPSVPTERIFGLVFEPGITESEGKGDNIIAEAGYGKKLSLPNDTSWTWFPAAYLNDFGNFDRYYSYITVDSVGAYNFAYRFRFADGDWVYADTDGNDLGGGGYNGYNPVKAGDLLVTLKPGLVLEKKEFVFTVPVNVVQNRFMILGNSGEGVLRYNLAEVDSNGIPINSGWIQAAPAYKDIPPMKKENIVFTIDPNSLEPDSSYSALFLLTTNDPDNDSISIKISLRTLAEGSTGLSGFLKNAAGGDLASAGIVEVYSGDDLLQTITTGLNGFFTIYGLEPNVYRLRAFGENYYPSELLNVTVPNEKTVRITLGRMPPIIPTPDWVDFYGDQVTFNQKDVRKGDIITALDPNGILCGSFTVAEPGKFGLMHVYGDDAFTSVDEGAEEGDTLKFFINDFPVDAVPVPIWGGAVNKVSLSAESFDIIALKEGYNLISFTTIPDDTSLQTTLSTIDGKYSIVQGFDVEWGGARTYIDSLDGLGFNDLKTVDPFHGYWIKMDASSELSLQGPRIPSDTPIPLEEGWNLVSYLPEGDDSVNRALASIDNKYSVVNGFDHSGALTYVPGSLFNDLDVLSNGSGYWIKMSSPGILNYSKKHSPPPGSKPEFSEIITDRSSIIPTPFVNDLFGYINVDSYPVSIGSIIEVIDPDGVVCGRTTVTVEGQFGILHVYGDDVKTADVDEGALEGDLLRILLNGVEIDSRNVSMIWRSGYNLIKVKADLITGINGELSSNLPERFDLMPNYPNPFNATTTLNYQLPVRENLEIKIFNILGQVETVLFDGVSEAGYHSLVWNGKNRFGTDLASGVYLCRMESAGFNKTIKLILLK